jgi:uncharacterized protein
MEQPTAVAANTLVVVGTGAATLTPEIADLSVGLQVTASTPGAALGQVTEASRQVLQVAHQHGLADSELRTHGVSVGPEFDPQSRQITGYTATHSLGLRLTRIAEAADVIDAVTQAAGNALRLGGFQLTTADTAEVRAEAAANAVADARTRAQRLAEAAGVHLGSVISIVEEPTGPGGGYSRPASGMAFLSQSRSAVPIQAGTDEITARVVVTFQLTA